MAALNAARLALLLTAAQGILALVEDSDATAPPDPEAPTATEIHAASALLDEANGKLEVLRTIATDPLTTTQEKLDLILQTLGPAP